MGAGGVEKGADGDTFLGNEPKAATRPQPVGSTEDKGRQHCQVVGILPVNWGVGNNPVVQRPSGHSLPAVTHIVARGGNVGFGHASRHCVRVGAVEAEPRIGP